MISQLQEPLIDKRKALEIARHYLPIYKAHASFHEFVKQAWMQVEGPTVPFVDGWHIGAICEHLEACYRREIRNLIINVPPRCGKSILVSVMFPAWVWIQNPCEKFLYASYGQDLSTRDSRRCRALINSPWYRERWGHLFELLRDQNTKKRFDNNKKGYRIATSTGGSATGEGGNFRIWDDANNAKDGESKVKRNATNDWHPQVWSSRHIDIATDVDIGIAQRMHENDLSGFLLNNDDEGLITHLMLPMEFEVGRRSKTIILPSTNGKVWEDPRKEEGELLWPERLGPTEVKNMKKEMVTAYRIAGQLQQRPAPSGGQIIKRSWFKMWKDDKPPVPFLVVQSWDTALEVNDRRDGCYSACTTWGVFKDKNRVNNIILLSLWRGMVEYPELRNTAIRLYRDYRNTSNKIVDVGGSYVPDIVLVEAKANGSSLIQDLCRAGINAFRFNPGRYGDKMQRVELSTYMIEGGRVWIPGKPPDYNSYRRFGEELIQMCEVFPAADARDVVDTMSQCILRLRDDGYLTHVTDHEYDSDDSYLNMSMYGPDMSRVKRRSVS